ncbi:hypothetical protein BV25DRAFT_1768670, partial [Artomyces pyxidatus]
MSSVVPLRLHRLLSLGLTWAFGVIGGSVGLNGLIKGNQEKSKLRHSVPPGVTVHIDTNDIYQSGVIVTTLCALIAVLATVFIHLTFFTRARASGRLPLGARFLSLQSGILAFCSVWLFATLVAYDDIFSNRTSKVSAFIGNVQLPPAIVQQTEQSFGQSPEYRHIDYLRLVAIIPWFTLLFSSIAAGVLFAASRR